jgi:CelD/BcsL family acetyltransferase involved in cellulose biosynthesis
MTGAPDATNRGTRVGTASGLEASAHEWDALADRISAPPFLRPGWFRIFDRAFGRGDLEVLAARRDGSLVGVVPISRRHGVVRSPTNWHTPWFGALAADDAAADQLASEVRARARNWFDLSFLQAADPFASAVLDLESSTIRRVIQRSPYVVTEGSCDDFESLHSRRRQLRKAERRLSARGAVSFEVVDSGPRLEAALEEGLAIEDTGWKSHADTSILSQPATARFYFELAEWAAARGELRLWFLRLDRRAIAFAYCLEADGVHYQLKTGFDPEYRRFGPGVLLTREKIKHAFEAGIRSYEFLGAADSHKLEWTDRCHELVRVQGFSRAPGGVAGAALWRYGRPIAKRAVELGRRLPRGRDRAP